MTESLAAILTCAIVLLCVITSPVWWFLFLLALAEYLEWTQGRHK